VAEMKEWEEYLTNDLLPELKRKKRI